MYFHDISKLSLKGYRNMLFKNCFCSLILEDYFAIKFIDIFLDLYLQPYAIPNYILIRSKLIGDLYRHPKINDT